MTPMEKLEFGLRWEKVRASYFQKNNNNGRAGKLMSKIKGIEAEINAGNYHNKENNESAYK